VESTLPKYEIDERHRFGIRELFLTGVGGEGPPNAIRLAKAAMTSAPEILATWISFPKSDCINSITHGLPLSATYRFTIALLSRKNDAITVDPQ
jgi:hypothetical protein